PAAVDSQLQAAAALAAREQRGSREIVRLDRRPALTNRAGHNFMGCCQRRDFGSLNAAQRSRIAVTPMPPAVQADSSPRLARASPARILASVARIRVPVAANGCPMPTLPPFTLSLARSMLPSGAGNPSTSRQYSRDSQALSVHSSCAANAS